jgi:hypothetical protein
VKFCAASIILKFEQELMDFLSPHLAIAFQLIAGLHGKPKRHINARYDCGYAHQAARIFSSLQDIEIAAQTGLAPVPESIIMGFSIVGCVGPLGSQMPLAQPILYSVLREMAS